jgi:hypothetical protein
MTPADLTLPTPGANPLAVLPPRCRIGARVEPWISGVTAVRPWQVPFILICQLTR